jgi:hypothetical protein
MSEDKDKYILVDGKYLFAEEDVESIGSMHEVSLLETKEDAPTGSADLTGYAINDASYTASEEVSKFNTAGTINLNMGGLDKVRHVNEYAHTQGVKEALTDRWCAFAYTKDI